MKKSIEYGTGGKLNIELEDSEIVLQTEITGSKVKGAQLFLTIEEAKQLHEYLGEILATVN